MTKRPSAFRSSPVRPGGKRCGGGMPSRPAPRSSVPASARLTPKARLHMVAAGLVIAGAVLILASPALWAAILALALFAGAAGTLVLARRA
ncbi:hypothetical protein [Nitrospirillum sp. BR 11828]|uniref:hypothetical protein n=1 Tax=Nitrospirillum sp. BR 11828 TaxID=3104325 RepID=UPI002ACAA606|nr:hypothetical protein [Nitrospirillum sp. BR 11828]MDZ5648214.1 hypothetical protein [Nitrospirillum sp. BR 11828]